MKCECGHSNPVGTILCESCGKPLDEHIANQEFIVQEMRYDGKARRSLRSPVTALDGIWSFFSSVRTAIILIILTLVAAGIGTIFPQQDWIPSVSPKTYYAEQYGVLGEWFYRLGFSDMYHAPWFVLLLVLIGISLVICSLDRVVPLYRALKNQTVCKSVDFIVKQKVTAQQDVIPEEKEQIFSLLKGGFREKFYHIRQEPDALLMEKGRWSRWGPYVNHIGLILFLVGLMLRYLPGWYLDEFMWIQEGELKKVPQTPYYLKNERATVEFYAPPSSVVKSYQTRAVLYRKEDGSGQMHAVHQQEIRVNAPLKYRDLYLFQSDFESGHLRALTLKVMHQGKDIGAFTLHFNDLNTRKVYSVGQGVIVRLLEYYPDFVFDSKQNRPMTRSSEPNQPAFVFELQDKRGKKERSWVIAGQRFSVLNPNKRYQIELGKIHMTNRSGLMVRVDKRLSVLLFSGIIVMIGLMMGFYSQHRRIWIRYLDGTLYMGAHTNKNWLSLSREVQVVMRRAGIAMPANKTSEK